MTTRRQQRVAEQVCHELSELIEREIDDPRLELISITDATISPDLCDASVYVSSLQGEAARDEVLAGLEAARGFLRHGLAERLRLRVVPNLHFHWDKSLETGDRISRLIDQIEEADADAQRNDASARSL
jgi:ribosome-binding factor A